MKELVIATRNLGKFNYFKEAFQDLPLTLLSLQNLGINRDFIETGNTFEQDSENKAKFFHSLCNMPTLSDDGGLAIDILNGEPGILSRRWPGHDASDEELVQLMLTKLKGVPFKKRTAKFIDVITVVLDEENIIQARGEISGILLEEPKSPYKPGLPWSSFFYIPKIKKVHCELTIAESMQYSHRGQASKKIKDQLINLI